MSSLKDELAELTTQTRKLLKEYRIGDTLREEALRASVPGLIEFITRCYKQRQFHYSLQLIAVLQVLGRTLKIGRIEAHALTLRGIIQHILGLFYEALASYRKAATIYNKENYDQGKCTVLQRMGETFLALLRYEEALISFGRVLQIDPDNLECCLGKANALELLGRDTEAIECYRRALVIDPGNKRAHRGLAGLGVEA